MSLFLICSFIEIIIHENCSPVLTTFLGHTVYFLESESRYRNKEFTNIDVDVVMRKSIGKYPGLVVLTPSTRSTFWILLISKNLKNRMIDYDISCSFY